MERVCEQREAVEAIGIALADNPHTAFHMAALYQDSLMPDYDELLQIKSFIDYKISTVYSAEWRAKLSVMALPGDWGHNTVYLRKGHSLGASGWFYKLATWETFGWPNPASDGFRPLSLVEVLDHAETLLRDVSPKWTAWKASDRAFQPLPAAAPLGPRARASALASGALERVA